MNNKISASQVKSLREITNAGLLDCKKALTETQGNEEEAIKWLREKGIASQAKRSDRDTSEGVVAINIASDNSSAAIVSIQCETDFVARNKEVWGFARQMASAAVQNAITSKDILANHEIDNTKISDIIIDKSATIKENIQLGTLEMLAKQDGTVVCGYVHGNIVGDSADASASKETGTFGVVVRVKSKGSSEADLVEFGNKLAMHIAAMNPDVVSQADLTDKIMSEEREIALAKISENPALKDKPDAQKNGIAEGMIKKAVTNRVLNLQQYALNDKLTVKQAADEAKAEIIEFKKIVIGKI